MKYGPFLFLGLLCCMAASSLTFVLAPQMQIGGLEQTNSVADLPVMYPSQPAGVTHQGAEVYRANNCAACHTLQIRPRNLGPDLQRGLGFRYSVARDYIFDKPVMLGLQRVGPDLSNVGARMNPSTILLHLYNPRATVDHAIMPPYPFLFEKRKIGRVASPDALVLPATLPPLEKGYEIVPRKEALSLAYYLTSLRQSSYLFEAPPPQKAKPVATTDTNAPAATTNSPAK